MSSNDELALAAVIAVLIIAAIVAALKEKPRP